MQLAQKLQSEQGNGNDAWLQPLGSHQVKEKNISVDANQVNSITHITARSCKSKADACCKRHNTSHTLASLYLLGKQTDQNTATQERV